MTIGSDEPRHHSLYWRPLSRITEITLYPLLWGQSLLCFGRRDQDTWQLGYYYPDVQSGFRAAESWDGVSDPGHGWIRRVTWDQEKLEDEEI